MSYLGTPPADLNINGVNIIDGSITAADLADSAVTSPKLANSGVTAGTYTKVTVSAKGLVTSASTPNTLSGYSITDAQPLDADLTAISALSGTGLARRTGADTWSLDSSPYITGNQTITVSGDLTGSGTTSLPLTLVTVNSNTGTFGNASSTGSFTVNAKGLVTAASSVPIQITESQITDGSLLARVGSNETITGSWQFNNPVSVVAPVSGSNATTKDYVDQAIAGLSWKTSVLVATTANIALTGLQTIDGVAVTSGQRVLVKNQTLAKDNGVYVASSGSWVRANDFDSVSPLDEINGAAVFVQQGVTLADTAWTQANAVATVGTDPLAFVQFAGANTFAAGNGMTLSGNTFNVGTASTSRIVVNVDDIDLATVTDSGTGTFKKITTDGYGRVTGTTNVVAADVTALVDSTYVNVSGDTMTGNLILSGDGQLLRPQASTTAGVPGLRIANESGVRKLEALYVGSTAATTYGVTAGNAVINTPPGTSLNFGTADTLRMTLDTSGNLGIGTSAPAARLEVQGAAFNDVEARIRSNAVGNISRLTFADNSGVTAYINGYNSAFGSGNNYALTFGINGVERARIDSVGRFGIGKTPTFYLDVNGSADGKIASFNGPTSNLNISNTTSELVELGLGLNDSLAITMNGTERMRLDANGKLGINNSTPQKLLHVQTTTGSEAAIMVGSSVANTSFRGYGFGAGASDSTEYGSIKMELNGGEIRYTAGYATWGGWHTFYTNGVERMRIDSVGNIGIGATPSGGSKLDINAGANYGGATITNTYSFSAPNYHLRLIGDLNTFGYIAQVPAAGGISLSAGAKYYGSGNWITDTSTTSAAAINVVNGVVSITSNFALTAATQFTPTEIVRIANNSTTMTVAINGYTNTLASMKGATASIRDLTAISSPNTSGMAGLGFSSAPGLDWVIGKHWDGASSRFVIKDGAANLGTNLFAFDSAGNFGIGVNPGAWGSSFKVIQAGPVAAFYGAPSAAVITTNSYNDGTNSRYLTTAAHTYYVQSSTASVWGGAPSGSPGAVINSTEYMRLESGGKLLLGTSTVIGSAIDSIQILGSLSGGQNYCSLMAGATSGVNAFAMRMYSTTAGALVGSISFSSSATSYNTSSDYRLKDISGPITTSGSFIDALNPVQGTWKIDGTPFAGFLAHEVQEVSPSSVHGVKDGEEMQSMSYSSAELIANMVAEIKDLRKRLAALESK